MPELISNRYEIIKQLGSGGFGRVYLCKDIEQQKEVAIKVLLPVNEDDPKARERFEKEARRTINLDHENIIDVKDFGYDDKGIPYIVMEYLPGTLGELLEETKNIDPE